MPLYRRGEHPVAVAAEGLLQGLPSPPPTAQAMGLVDVEILDGYIDEPSLFGVPPFLSPYPRLIAGAAWDCGATVRYTTIDQLRAQPGRAEELQAAPLLVVIAGNTVPGRYVRGLPVSVAELRMLLAPAKGTVVLGGGMGRYGSLGASGLSTVVTHSAVKDPDALVADLLSGVSDPPARFRTAIEWQRWSLLGAPLARAHPDFPRPLTAEVDLYRGCIRVVSGGCHFCSEIALGHPRVRPPQEVVAELVALERAGVRAARLAGACVYSYGAQWSGQVPSINVPLLRELFEGIAAATSFEVLHIDNGDPAMVAREPEAAAEVTGLIVQTCTSGNGVSFGLESADPVVQQANNLNATPEQVREAVRLVNRLGGHRGPSGLPALLPGINFLSGLRGQRSDSFRQDLAFLRSLRDEGLLLRRINLRQVVDLRGQFVAKELRQPFQRFKRAVREEIDQPLLRALVPVGTVLRDLYPEYRQGALMFCRQRGSYPLLVGVPLDEGRGAPIASDRLDLAVTGHGFRSVSAVPFPLDPARASRAQLQALPGVGRRRAEAMLSAAARGDDPLGPLLGDPSVAAAVAPFLTPPGRTSPQPSWAITGS